MDSGPEDYPLTLTSMKRTAPAWNFSRLTREEIVRIQALAGSAWKAQLAAGLVEIPTGISASAACKAWRYEETVKAGCPQSLSDCRQNHMRSLKAHFSALLRTAGGDAAAYRNYTRTGRANSRAAEDDTHEARELWEFKLREACQAGGLHYPSYPAAIAQRNYKTTMGNLTADQLRKLFYTVTTRSRQKQAAAPPATVPPDLDDDDRNPF